jgi:hypothetical protein
VWANINAPTAIAVIKPHQTIKPVIIFYFLSLINHNPISKQTVTTTEPAKNKAHLGFIPPKNDDISTAVVTYLDISNNHFPNSFFTAYCFYATKLIIISFVCVFFGYFFSKTKKPTC